jgi:hypothetical protein
VTDSPPSISVYFKALALPNVDISLPDHATARKAALIRAHDLRKFEIENYWKRATYFWAFQLAAFSTLGLLWPKIADSLQPSVLMIPAGLGAITAQVGLLTAQGSKFWQENWEGHVDALEDDVEGRLTQVIVVKRGTSHSVSRVNEALLKVLLAGWVIFFLCVAGTVVCDGKWQVPPWAQSLAGVVALAIVLIWIYSKTKTNLRGWKLDIGSGQWNRTGDRDYPRPFIILRDTFQQRAEPQA